MNNQDYSRKPESESPPLPIVDLIVLAAIVILMIVFSAIAASKTFSAYKYPLRSLLDVFSVIAVFEVIIWIARIFSRKKRSRNHRDSSDFKSLKALCIIIAIIGLLNAPMFFFDIGSTNVESFFEKREYTATQDYLTYARVCDVNGYHYEAIAYGSNTASGDIFPGSPSSIKYGNRDNRTTVVLE